MSSDVVACPQCGTNLQNSATVAGQVVACPQCQIQLQMPPLPQPASAPAWPVPGTLPPAVESSPSARTGTGAGSAVPLVQATRATGEAAASVADRLRKRSNPWVIVFAVAMAVVLIAVGAVAYQAQQADAARRRFEKEMVGNWELVPGQTNLERWDFAFHADGRFQMVLGNQLSDGRWRVTSLRGATGYVLIQWPDDAPETMRVQLGRSTMQIALDSVGNFAFRAAAP